MKKAELEALGLDAEQIRAVQALNGRDMERAEKRPGKCEAMQAAIIGMLPMLKRSENLKSVLTQVNYLYYTENRPPQIVEVKKELPSVVTTEQLETDALSAELNTPTVIVADGEGSCQGQ